MIPNERHAGRRAPELDQLDGWLNRHGVPLAEMTTFHTLCDALDAIRALCLVAGMTPESTPLNYLQGVFYRLRRELRIDARCEELARQGRASRAARDGLTTRADAVELFGHLLMSVKAGEDTTRGDVDSVVDAIAAYVVSVVEKRRD